MGTKHLSLEKESEILKASTQLPWLKSLLLLLKDLRYGSVTVVVQDGRVVQIEKNEKIRFS
ncbi:MAG TPA: YezD family protein [Syntrophomonadaceae bacterium]|nr:YezD family protein [Syntrophomonadaceae bacterium]